MQLSITGEFKNFRFKSETFSVCNVRVLKACPATPKGVARECGLRNLKSNIQKSKSGG